MCLGYLVYTQKRSGQSYKISPAIFFSTMLTSTYKRHSIKVLIRHDPGSLLSAGIIRIFDLRVSHFLGQGIVVFQAGAEFPPARDK